VVQRFGRRPAARATVLLSFVAGALLVFLPLVVRNHLIVAWALSTRGARPDLAAEHFAAQSRSGSRAAGR
jgi:hypothetical protein